jgi:D-alanine-D-alanine ligase-like ATP-grasp enzyme
MRYLKEFRSGKPASYPDQSVYAEFACAEYGLRFRDLDGGSGLVFTVASNSHSIAFGSGRGSSYPQNSASASTLASDKYFTNRILEDAGLPTLGGDYFFLHDRHRAFRAPGHEREDALLYLQKLNGPSFVKPLLGSRGDFAQIVANEAGLVRYIETVSRHYDSILMQSLVSGRECRVFLLDQEVIYTARKYPPSVVGDGVRSIRDLLNAHNATLQDRGLSPAIIAANGDAALDRVLDKDARWEIPGRMNLSAGGKMVLEAVSNPAALKLAAEAVRALGLRAAAVDLFTDIDGDPERIKVIEVNANPSIRLLEESDCGDLILKIWRHAFCAMKLL